MQLSACITFIYNNRVVDGAGYQWTYGGEGRVPEAMVWERSRSQGPVTRIPVRDPEAGGAGAEGRKPWSGNGARGRYRWERGPAESLVPVAGDRKPGTGAGDRRQMVGSGAVDRKPVDRNPGCEPGL